MSEARQEPDPEALGACDFCHKHWLRFGAMHHIPSAAVVLYWCGDCDRSGLPAATFAGLPLPAGLIEIGPGPSIEIEPIAETVESIGLVLIEPEQARIAGARVEAQPHVAGCYRMAEPLHPSSVTGEARVLIVRGWEDYRAAPFEPGHLPASAGLVAGGFVGGVRVSPQYVALVRRAWGSDVLWGAVERGAARYIAAWKLRRGAKALPIAALAPLGEKSGTVDPARTVAEA